MPEHEQQSRFAGPVAQVPDFVRAEMAANPLLMMQGAAGNAAVASLVEGSTAAPSTAVPVPKELTLRTTATNTADDGRPAEEMSVRQLEDAIEQHDEWVARQDRTSPELQRREQRLAELHAAHDRKATESAARPRRRKGKGVAATTMPPRPRSLSGSLNVQELTEAQVQTEVDLITDYLAAGPSAQERRDLELELGFLRERLERDRGEARAERKAEVVRAALVPTSGAETDQLLEMLRRLDRLQPDPDVPGMWLIRQQGEVIQIPDAVVVDVKAKIADSLSASASAVYRGALDVAEAWAGRDATNRRHPIVHGLVSWSRDVDDIPRADIERMENTARELSSIVQDLARSGQFALAGDKLMAQDGLVRHWAQKVGRWDAALVSGAGRWVLALTIAKEALGMMAGAGLVKLVGTGGSLASTAWRATKVTAATTAVAGTSAGIAAEAVGADAGTAIRKGSAEGFGLGAGTYANAAGKVASLDDVASAAGALGKAKVAATALAVDTGLSVTTNVAQAAIGGDSIGDAATKGAVTAPISSLGGAAVKAGTASEPLRTAGMGVVGATSATAGTAATGGDVTAEIVGMGALGGAYSHHVLSQPDAAPTGSSDGQRELPAGMPSPADPTTSTLTGTGIAPRLPGVGAPETLLGTGIAPRLPGLGTADTVPAIGTADTAPSTSTDPANRTIGTVAPASTDVSSGASGGQAAQLSGPIAPIANPAAALGLYHLTHLARGGRVVELDGPTFARRWRESGGQGEPPAAWFQSETLVVDLHRLDAQVEVERVQARAEATVQRPAHIPVEVPPGVERRVAEPIDDVERARRVYEEQQQWAGRGGAQPEFTKDADMLQDKWVKQGGTGPAPPAWLDHMGVIHIDWTRIYPTTR